MCLRTALTTAALVAASPALALDLTWRAPPGCPDRAEALARLGATADITRRLTAEATVVRDASANAWTLRLVTDDGATTGERELSAPSCRDLTDAAVLLLSLALDTVEGDPPAPPAPRRGSPAVVTRVVRTTTRSRGGLRVSMGITVGPLPSPALMPSLRAWIGWGRWRLEVAASVMSAQTVVLPEGALAELRAAQVGLRGCRALTRAPLEFAACGGVEVGLLQGRGARVLRPAEGAATMAGVIAGASLAWRFSRAFAAVATLDAAWNFARPRFVILGVGEVHTPSPLGLSASLGIEASW